MLRFVSTMSILLALACAASGVARAEDVVASAVTQETAPTSDPAADASSPAAPEQGASEPTPEPPASYRVTPESPPASGRPRPEVGGWPSLFLMSAEAVFARVDYRGASFSDRHGLTQLGGETLRLRHYDAIGGSVSLRLVPTRYLEVGLGIGVLRPRVGSPRPAVTPRSEVVYVTDAHVAYWYGQLNLMTHMGPTAVSAGVRVGWARMVLQLGGDGPGMMRSARVTAGPQLDLRAHLYRSLFVHVGGYADMLQWPDAQIEAGLGLAHR